MREVAGEQHMLTIRLTRDQRAQLTHQAARTNDEYSGGGVPFANGAERFELQRDIVFRLEPADADNERLVRRGETCDRRREIGTREIRERPGGHGMRWNEADSLRSATDAMKEIDQRSEEHTSELQSHVNIVC